MNNNENLNLGWFELCLNVADVRRSLEFYEKLGFRRAGGKVEEGYVVVRNGDCRLALYQGYLEGNLLNFRGQDVFEIAETLKQRGISFKKEPFIGPDGDSAALLEDPDGNEIYIVRHPGETRADPAE